MDYERRNEHIIICLFVMICIAIYIINLHFQIRLKNKEIDVANIALTSCQNNMMEVEFTWVVSDECFCE
jgi:hypothetical protein